MRACSAPDFSTVSRQVLDVQGDSLHWEGALGVVRDGGGYGVGPAKDPDRYRVGDPVGSGAEGILYRGTLTTDDGVILPVAVKMLHPRFGDRISEWQRRWREQVELLRSLHVQGVVGVRDGFAGPLPHPIGDPPPATETLYLVMNWVEGEPLDEWVWHHPERDALDVLKRLLAVATALDLMHAGGLTGGVPVLHRDVKPANILLTDAASVLVDFGMVRSLNPSAPPAGVAGTPGYIAPEVAERGEWTPAADRYALGGVVYFVLTGEDPPHRPDIGDLRAALLNAPAVGGRLDVVERVLTMLHPDPGVRPEPAANWLAQVRRSSLSIAECTLPPLAPTATTPPRLRRLPTVAVALATAIVGAVAVGVLIAGLAGDLWGGDTSSGATDTSVLDTVPTETTVADGGSTPTSPTTGGVTPTSPTTGESAPGVLPTLDVGRSVEGSVADRSESFQALYEGAAGSRIRITVVLASGDMRPGIAVLDPAGDAVCGNPGSSITCDIEADSTYKIEVRHYQNPLTSQRVGDGTFAVRIECVSLSC